MRSSLAILHLLWLWLWLSLAIGTAAAAPPEPRVDDAVFDGSAASSPVITDNVHARLLAERDAAVPGEPIDVALVLDIRAHWHTYWRNPGDSGEPPRIRWQVPDGVEVGEIRWPLPEPIPVGPLVNYGYSGRAVHLVALEVPADWPIGEPVEIEAEATWLVCEEECIPEQGRFALTLGTAAAAGSAPPGGARAALFSDARARLPRAGVVTAELDRTADELRLRVPAAALPADIAGAYFFADAWGLVDHAAPQRLEQSDDGETLLLRLQPGEIAASVPATGLLKITAAGTELGLMIDATGNAPVSRQADAGGASAGVGAAGLGLPLALGFALLGGLVLNLMPCVFPVLAIKALGLAGQGGAGFRHRALHGLAYTAGVLTFFLALGLLLLALRAGGVAVGWGFQLQSPLFVALMAYLFVVLGMSLAGGLTLGTSLMGVGQGSRALAQDGHVGAFATGALAALVAAPCTAPFMGAALGYAMTVPWYASLAIVLALGLGMALPFLLLAVLPRLAQALPRPGAWMETLKQALAFPMFATAAWLFWVLAVQAGPAGLAAAFAGALLLAFALWLHERLRLGRAPWPQVGAGVALAGLAGAVWLGAVAGSGVAGAGSTAATQAAVAASARTAALPAEPYSPAKLSAARGEGRPVFVNMTAAWCITCLVNERVALSGDAVARAFVEQDVLYLKGDWTNRDADITDYLAGFGRNGVPIYVFYPPGGEPRVLPQVLTEAIVLAGIGAG